MGNLLNVTSFVIMQNITPINKHKIYTKTLNLTDLDKRVSLMFDFDFGTEYYWSLLIEV